MILNKKNPETLETISAIIREGGVAILPCDTIYGLCAAYGIGEKPLMEIKGRDLVDGLPKNVNVNSAEIRDALVEPLAKVIDAIKSTLEETPPELSADIIDHGITLAGGGALLRGLDRLINRETGMPVYIAEYPLDCVAEGTGKILENISDYQDALTDNIKYY